MTPLLALLILSLAPSGGTATAATPASKKAAAKPSPARKITTAKSSSSRTSAKKKSARKTASKKKTTARRRVPVSRRAPAVSAKTRASAVRQVSYKLDTTADVGLLNPGALVPFFERLYRSAGEGGGAVHVLHFGDSHTAADNWPASIRELLQQVFGDGGAGFSLPGSPFRGYRRFDVRSRNSKGWKSEGLRTGAGDGMFGLGGVSISTESADETVSLEGECERVEVFYLRQPGGGSLELLVDGNLAGMIDTDGELGPGHFALDTFAGQHTLRLRTMKDAPVRLLGWVTENRRGITYETLGINGAEAALILRWDQAMFAEYLRRRAPALVVLAYGTNEASNVQWDYSSYRQMFASLLARIRQALPEASILVAGPPDRLRKVRRKLQPIAKLDDIVEAQREAAAEFGCAFWDTRYRMGGKGSIAQWVTAGLAQGDYVHFTAEGYRRLGQTLFADLMQQYQIFKQFRSQPDPQPVVGAGQ